MLKEELDQQISLLVGPEKEGEHIMRTPQLEHLHPSQPLAQEPEQALQEQGVIFCSCFFSFYFGA